AVRSQTETPKRYRYTGKERDEESGFSYHGARYYAPWLGRWASCDPAGMGDDANLYAYVRANPTRGRDPTGRSAEGLEGKVAEANMFVREVLAAAKEQAWLTQRVNEVSASYDAALKAYKASGNRDMAAVEQMEAATRRLEFVQSQLADLSTKALALNTATNPLHNKTVPPITRGEELASE